MNRVQNCGTRSEGALGYFGAG